MKGINLRQRSALTASKAHLKKAANWLARRLGRKQFFELSTMERVASTGVLGFPNKQINATHRWCRWGFQDTLVGWSLLILVFLYIIVQAFGVDVGAENLWTEYWGLIFDVMVILVGFGLIQNWKQKRETIARQHELIEDFKRWDSEEARNRIVGAIRRLERLNSSRIDFSGGILRNVKLRATGITKLTGSKLSGSSWASEEYTMSIFKNVDFSGLDCREVQFEKASMMNGFVVGGAAQYKDCDFWNADLNNSTFDGAALHWEQPAADDMYEAIDEDETGQPIRTRAVAGRFNEADLAYVSFKYCDFKNADFRECYNIETADFRGAVGLETCLFDDEETKAKITAQSKEPIRCALCPDQILKPKNINCFGQKCAHIWTRFLNTQTLCCPTMV